MSKDSHTMVRLMIGYEAETTAVSVLVSHNSSAEIWSNLGIGICKEVESPYDLAKL
jgi:hypothetical protein